MMHKIPLGEKLGEGAEMVVFAHKENLDIAVKLPKKRVDIAKVFIERLTGQSILEQANLEQHFLDTRYWIPGITDQGNFPFLEFQTRISSTLYDDLKKQLTQKDTEKSLNIIKLFLEFEASVLWRSGVIIQDAGNILCNIAQSDGLLKLLDYSSLTTNPEGLRKLVERKRSHLRIQLLLAKLEPTFGQWKNWSLFSEQVWKMTHSHYHFDNIKEYWPANLV